MEAFLPGHVKTHPFQSPVLLKPKISNYSSILHKPKVSINFKAFGSLKCCKGGTVGWELERNLQEMNMEDEIVGKWKENCRQSGGVVELLECLEKEAIMGEDEGKEATDYNRRAQIFDRSSRVFKALKENTSSTDES
ncbi:Hypothetical predicted protein [Olea europaea subsp. europaea]|uniref:Uncharacterized protein n=1 Tax=Olea europaea subsp. europaea TaxID=158383 RepID=A0A8S0TNG8_OLEEU|nr:Hypothetical predicted protein [Olea europaea subsp. europaea]